MALCDVRNRENEMKVESATVAVIVSVLAAGQAVADGIGLTDAQGRATAVQLSDVVYWPDGKSVKSSTLSFLATLEPNALGQWTMSAAASIASPAAMIVRHGPTQDVVDLSGE